VFNAFDEELLQRPQREIMLPPQATIIGHACSDTSEIESGLCPAGRRRTLDGWSAHAAIVAERLPYS
jgi:hypothetical protein